MRTKSAQIHLYLEPDLHKLAKGKALLGGYNLSEVIRQLVAKWASEPVAGYLQEKDGQLQYVPPVVRLTK